MGEFEKEFVTLELRRGAQLTQDWLRRGARKASSVSEHYLGNDALGWIRIALLRESVPYLSAMRFTEAGLEKHKLWQDTWNLQRREDRGEKVGDIPVPPKYDQKDHSDATYWSLRGKLDVPKERFISYPGCESDEDQEPVYGWAGWNHLQRAQALAALYQDRKTREGWPKERLLPMLAGHNSFPGSNSGTTHPSPNSTASAWAITSIPSSAPNAPNLDIPTLTCSRGDPRKRGAAGGRSRRCWRGPMRPKTELAGLSAVFRSKVLPRRAKMPARSSELERLECLGMH